MKKTRLALAAVAAMGAMVDVAVTSQRQSVSFGNELAADLLATNSTYAAAPAGGYQSQGSPQRSQGQVVFDATAIVATDSVSIVTGFRPRKITWWNATDRIKGEWFEGMANDGCLKTAANGTQTLEVTGGNGGITVTNNGFSVLQNATLALILASKTCYFEAVA